MILKGQVLSFILCLFCSLIAVPHGSLAATQVGQYKTHELIFTASGSPENPFDTYLLKLEITAPTGEQFTIDGFFDGDGNGGQAGKTWKARITPYVTGIWSWRTVPGDAPDNGLEGLSGQFECVGSGDVGGVTRDGQHFRLQSGDPIYLQGNFLDFSDGLVSTHVFMGEVVSDATRDAVMTRQREVHNANKINVYLANAGDYGGESVTPWVGTASGNDKAQMGLARWKAYDDHVRRFKDDGMFAELWFFADESGFGKLSQADKNRLFRYAMARLSAFSHTLFVIALEWGEGWSASAVRASGDYIQAHNPWGRLLSVHSSTLAKWDFSEDSWATFIATQAGNKSSPSTVNNLAVAMRNSETIPHLDEEYGLHSDGSSSSTLTRLRSNTWANFTGGAAGGGTGSDLKAFMRFLSQSRVPFRRMHPANHLVSDGGSTRFCLAEVGRHYVVYSTGSSFTLDVSGSGLTGRWFNPRDPNANLGSPFSVLPGTQTFTPPTSTTSDWVLWISNGASLGSGVLHPSAGATLTQEIAKPGSPVSSYTLTVAKAGSGSGTVSSTPAGVTCGATCSANYAKGTTVTLTVTPAPGSTFSSWSGDADCTDGAVILAAAKTCIATFTSQGFMLTVTKAGSGAVSSTPAGINCGADCFEAYTSGASVTLTATPVAGSTFSGWSGSCTGAGTCTVVLSTATSVTATFSQPQPVNVKIGVFRPGTGRWYLDLNGNGLLDACTVDACLGPFGQQGDRPVIGDWAGAGTVQIGVFELSTRLWKLDRNGNERWDDCTVDLCLGPIWQSTDLPVIGRWQTDSVIDKIGIYRPSKGAWRFDLNGNGDWDKCSEDGCQGPFGKSRHLPVVGDWTGTGTAKIGVFDPDTGMWELDRNGNGKLDGCTVDGCLGPFGIASDLPVVGDWTGTGTAKIGVFDSSTGMWELDLNDNGAWDGCMMDACLGPFGQQDDLPLVARW